MRPAALVPHRPLIQMFSMLALALLLVGCASTQGRHTTATLLGDGELAAVRTIDPTRLSTAAFPDKRWWRALGDPQLDALIDEALAGTPGLDAADARVRQAMALAGIADAGRKPTLDASAQLSGLQLPRTVAPAPLGGDFSTINLLMTKFTYNPDLWGGRRAAWQAALGRAQALQVEAQSARLTLSSNIAHAYITLAQACQFRTAAAAEQARARKLLELARQRVSAGIDNEWQLRQVESAIASASEQAADALQQSDSARTAIAVLLGKGPDRGLAIADPVLLNATAPGLPTVLPSELLGHRPDIVAARWQVEAAGQDIQSSEAAFYPTINLNALAGLAGGTLGRLFSGDALVLQGGPAISLPIFDAGRLRNQLAASNAGYALYVAQYNQKLVDALREVTDAIQSARSLDARLAAANQSRDAAIAAARIARLRYRAGIGTQLDVLAAEQPLLPVEQMLARLRAQRLGAMVDLDRALGGGLEPVGPNAFKVLNQ